MSRVGKSISYSDNSTPTTEFMVYLLSPDSIRTISLQPLSTVYRLHNTEHRINTQHSTVFTDDEG